MIVNALDCDRLCGFTATEMLSFSDVDKKHRCTKFAKNLVLKPLPDELEEWEESDEEEVTVVEEEDDDSTIATQEHTDAGSSVSSSTRTPPPKKTKMQRIVIKKQRSIKRYQLTLLKAPSTHITSKKDVLLNKIR